MPQSGEELVHSWAVKGHFAPVCALGLGADNFDSPAAAGSLSAECFCGCHFTGHWSGRKSTTTACCPLYHAQCCSFKIYLLVPVLCVCCPDTLRTLFSLSRDTNTTKQQHGTSQALQLSERNTCGGLAELIDSSVSPALCLPPQQLTQISFFFTATVSEPSHCYRLQAMTKGPQQHQGYPL